MTPPGPRAAVCGHDGQVRIDNPDDIRDYYAAVAGALIPHLAGRPVTVGTADGSLFGVERIDTADDLDYLLEQGAVTLATALPEVQRAPVMPVARTVAWCTLHVASGEGTGIATAATAALALCQAMTSDGLTAVVTTDGGEGLYVRAMGPGTRRRMRVSHGPTPTDTARTGVDGPWEIASGYAEELARNAPEIATVDPRQADGRALIDASPSWPGNVTPVPYSLVTATSVAPTAAGNDRRAGGRCVVPLDLDELAATTAGMPMDPGPQDIVGRLAARGDLAIALLDDGGDPRVG
jgi:hypothetical protein